MELAYQVMNLVSLSALVGALCLIFGYGWGYEQAQAAIERAAVEAQAQAEREREAERRKVLWFKTRQAS